MMYMKSLVATTTLILVLAACTSSKDTISNNTASEIYTSAKKKLQAGNYIGAIKDLEALDNNCPLGHCAQQVQLNLIYAYYKSADLLLAQASINRFLRFNPTHPNVDYVLYMRGVTNMERDDNALQKLFSVDRSDRNPEYTHAAFRDFMQLIRTYPNSQFAMDATKRLVYLKHRLAKHELSAIEYYDKRCAYVAVVNRVEKMLRDFSDTQATLQALPYMEKAYRKLQLNAQADKVVKIMKANPS